MLEIASLKISTKISNSCGPSKSRRYFIVYTLDPTEVSNAVYLVYLTRMWIHHYGMVLVLCAEPKKAILS